MHLFCSLLQVKGYLLALHIFQCQDQEQEQVIEYTLCKFACNVFLLLSFHFTGSKQRKLYEEITDVNVDLSLQSASVDLTTVKGPLFRAEAAGMT